MIDAHEPSYKIKWNPRFTWKVTNPNTGLEFTLHTSERLMETIYGAAGWHYERAGRSEA